MTAVALLLRGMRWRLGLSLLTVVTSTIAVAVAVLGPLYLRTAGDSVVRQTVGVATIAARGVTLSPSAGRVGSLAEIGQAERVVENEGGAHRWYGTPITTALSGVGLMAPDGSPLRSQLFWRTGICHVLRFREGGCNLGPGDVVVSDRSARELNLSMGHVIAAGVEGSGTPLPLRVTGIYAVPDLGLPYWWGEGPGDFPFGHTSGSGHIPEVDPLIASPATVLHVPQLDVPAVDGQVPLKPSRVNIDDENALRQATSTSAAALAHRGVDLTTQLPSLLAGADRQRGQMATIVAIAALQLVLLAVWILGALLIRSSDARRSDIRVARLRGFPTSSLLWVTAAEPAVLCSLGVVLGLGIAWGAMIAARNRLLDPAATVSPDWWVVAALALVILAMAGALALGTMRLLRSPGLSDAPIARPSTASRASVVADVVLLALSVVALVALATSGALGGHSNPVASAAPGLIALGVAVVAVQLVLFACRRAVSASANSPRVATFLAVREIVRRPAVLREARVLIIALCLACFATSAWSVARANRTAVATFAVGTSAVVTVTPSGVGLEQAVARADPHGRYAMAAVNLATASANVLAVDARRLPVAAFWPSGISRSTISATRRALTPPTAPEVRLPAGPVRVTARVTASGPLARRLEDVELALWVVNPQAGTTLVSLGALRPGRASYQAPLAVVCPGGCRLAGVGVIPVPGRQPPASGAVALHVLGVTTSRAAIPANLVPRGWRAMSGVQIHPAAAGGLIFVIPAATIAADTGAIGATTPPMASPADTPGTLPGAVTSAVQSLNGTSLSGGTVPGAGLDGNSLEITPAITTSALPRVGSDGVMVDLGLLSRYQINPTSIDATDEVWLGPAAPRNAIARLRAAGLHTDSVERASTLLRQAQHTGPAFADDFLLVATLAALLAAAASALGAMGATTRQRATELSALEVAGIRRRVLARSLAGESAVLALTMLFGAAAGVVAALMAIPSVPELPVASVIPLHYALPVGLVGAVSLIVLVVVFLVTAAVALALLRRMSPSLLRTAPDDTAG